MNAAKQALLASHLADVGNAGKHTLKAVEQAEPVLANGQVLIHDHDIVEERIDGTAQSRKGDDDGLEITSVKRRGNFTARGVGRIQQGKLGVAHELAVNLGAELRVGEVSGARISGGEVGEGLAVVGAGLLESMRELEDVYKRQRQGVL